MWRLRILTPQGTGPIAMFSRHWEFRNLWGFFCTGYSLAKWFGNQDLSIFLPIPQWPLKYWKKGSVRRSKTSKYFQVCREITDFSCGSNYLLLQGGRKVTAIHGFSPHLTPCPPALGSLNSGLLNTEHNHTIYTQKRYLFSDKQHDFHACAVQEDCHPFPFWKRPGVLSSVMCLGCIWWYMFFEPEMAVTSISQGACPLPDVGHVWTTSCSVLSRKSAKAAWSSYRNKSCNMLVSSAGCREIFLSLETVEFWKSKQTNCFGCGVCKKRQERKWESLWNVS